MLGLPQTTETLKQLPKKAIYAKFGMNATAKEHFDSDVSKIVIVNEISSSTTTISKGDEISSFFILLVSLKKNDYDEKNIALLSKMIPQNILYILEYEGKSQLAIYYTKLLHSEWKPTSEQTVKLNGLNLDAVWKNIVKQVGGIDVQQGNTLEEQIIADEKRKKTEKELARLEKLARAEKQPKKKFELVQQIKSLEDELSNITKTKVTANPKSNSNEPSKEKPLDTVKALSILPEYADDILVGAKTVEWRSWKTDYRGDLLICASSRKLKGYISGYALCMVKLVDVVPFTRKHIKGALMDGVPNPAGYAWILEDVRYIKPFKYKGQLHIYDVDASLVKVLAPIDTKEGDEVYENFYKPLYIEAGAEFEEEL